MEVKTAEVKTEINFAISQKEFEEFGCPVCGYAYGTWRVMGGGGVMVSCKNKLCHIVFYVLHNGIK